MANLLGIQSGAFRSAERAVGGDLATWLLDKRDEGESYQALAWQLRDLGVIVTPETVRNWCGRLVPDVIAPQFSS